MSGQWRPVGHDYEAERRERAAQQRADQKARDDQFNAPLKAHAEQVKAQETKEAAEAALHRKRAEIAAYMAWREDRKNGVNRPMPSSAGARQSHARFEAAEAEGDRELFEQAWQAGPIPVAKRLEP
jgi:hypothetical protein